MTNKPFTPASKIKCIPNKCKRKLPLFENSLNKKTH
jgi:hypothetical protein